MGSLASLVGGSGEPRGDPHRSFARHSPFPAEKAPWHAAAAEAARSDYRRQATDATTVLSDQGWPGGEGGHGPRFGRRAPQPLVEKAPPLAAECHKHEEQNFRRSTAALDIYPESWTRSYRETVAEHELAAGGAPRAAYCGRPKINALRPADFDMLKVSG
mmetsp:Transcript_58202/g.152897  ORF Transcript_58202/g.152897 Transcript_58202/m.152897 type:complete len:160 (-) Transcript_58202:412-891(-)